MAELTHFYDVQDTEQTTASAPWNDISGARIPAASLSASTKYLIFCHALMRGDSATDKIHVRVQTDDDSTIESKSEQVVEVVQTGSTGFLDFGFVHSFTTDGTPDDIDLQFGADGGASIVGVDQITFWVEELGQHGVEGTDYFEDIQAIDGTTEYSNLAATTVLAQLAGSDLGTDEWWILGYARADASTGSPGRWFDIRCDGALDSGSSNDKIRHRAEMEDVAEHRLVAFSIRHKASTGTPAVTVYGQESAAAANIFDGGAYLIALPTADFADFEWDYTEANLTVNGETTVASIGPYTPSVGGNHLIIGQAGTQTGSGLLHLHLEDGTTETRTGDQPATHNQEWDSTPDREYAMTLERISFSTAKTYNLRADRGAAVDVRHRWLIIVNLNTAGGSPQTIAVGAATESEVAAVVAPVKDIVTPLAAGSEMEVAQVLDPVKDIVTVLAAPAETELGQVIAPQHQAQIGVTTEEEAIQIITPVKTIVTPLGAPAETEVAQLIAAVKQAPVGAATEIEIAQVIDAIKTIVVPLAAASEVEAAQIILLVVDVVVAVNAAIEAEAAQVIAPQKQAPIGAAVEVEVTQLIDPVKVIVVPLVAPSELEISQVINPQLQAQVGAASEADAAQVITVEQPSEQIIAVGAATETEVAQIVAAVKVIITGLGAASETELAQAITFTKPMISSQRQVIDAAGFQNCVAVADSSIHTTVGARILAGSDVGGIWKSDDDGVTWQPSSYGLFNNEHTRVASIYWSPNTDNLVWAMTSSASVGNNAQFWRSVDGGATWELRSTLTGWSVQAGGSSPWPRETGKLIAEDSAGRILVATGDGLKLSTNSGGSFANRSIAARELTAIVIDPNDNNLVYTTADGGTNPGLYKITNAFTGSVSQTRLTGANALQFDDAQDLAVVDEAGTTVLYIAAGLGAEVGVQKIDDPAGTPTETVITDDTMDTTTAIWDAIDAVDDGGNTLVVVGCSNPTPAGEAIYRSTNGGSTWTNLTAGADFDVLGTIEEWWLLDSKPTYGMGNGTYDCVMVAIDRQDFDKCYLSGRSAVWASSDLKSTAAWNPAVKGVGAVGSWDSPVDPTNQARIAGTSVDWRLMASTDRFIAQPEQSEAINEVPWASAFAADGRLYMAFGDRNTQAAGEVYFTDNPFAAVPSYTDMGFNETTKRIIGVGVGENATSQPVVLCWVEAVGIRRSVNGTPEGGTKYANVSTGGHRHAYFMWDSNTGSDVYCYYGPVGLLHSDDYGATWTVRATRTTTGRGYGHAAQDPVIPTTIYVTTAANAWRFDDVDTASPTETAIGGSMNNPASVAVDTSGRLWICDQPSSSLDARIWMSEDNGATLVDFADDFYRAMGVVPFTLAAPNTTELWLTTDGQGILYATYSLGTIIQLNAAVESETAQAIVAIKDIITSLTAATELEVAQVIDPVKTVVVPLAAATEIEIAAVVNAAKAVLFTPATEVEMAQIIGALNPVIVALAAAAEVEIAQVIAVIVDPGPDVPTSGPGGRVTVGGIPGIAIVTRQAGVTVARGIPHVHVESDEPGADPV